MPLKSVAFSVRMAPEDAQFLAALRIPDAHTPSERLRALVQGERRRQQGQRDYRGALAMARDTLLPTLEQIQLIESHEQLHSELLHVVADWLPELLATLVSGLRSTESEGQREALSRLEAEVADRVFRLLESTLRLAVTSRVPGCDPEVVSKRIAPLLELVELIRSTRRER